MIPIDHLLAELFKITPNIHVPSRDLRILWSLHKQIASGNFLTKNQGKLLLKILKENEQQIKESGKIDFTLDSPAWSQPFRIINVIRKIFISKEKLSNEFIIEFTYSKELKQKISDLGRSVQGQIRIKNSKQYSIPLTEKNILLVVDTFKNKKFDIEPALIDFFNEIKQHLQNKDINFNILTSSNNKLLDQVKKEVGEINDSNLLLYDRRFKFQYNLPFTDSTNRTLTEQIAYRSSPKIWINSEKVLLSSIIESLLTLKRFPLLVVFDSHSVKENIDNLKNLQIALNSNNITDNIGIYFRLDNTNEVNKNFNLSISNCGYNEDLSEKTLVAGISSSKLPKFLLTTNWYPQTVISLTNNFRSNKASVYTSAVDLVIFYNKFQPLSGGINALL